jgi:hypothetical protein
MRHGGESVPPERSTPPSGAKSSTIVAMHFRYAASVALGLTTAVAAACGGGGSPTPGAPAATSGVAAHPSLSPAIATSAGAPPDAQTPLPRVDLDTALAHPCELLGDADFAAIGTPAGPGQPTSGIAGAFDSSGCSWSLSANGSIELRIYRLGGTTFQSDFAKSAVEKAAGHASATVEDIAGIGDYAGVEIPPKPTYGLTAEFDAQKDGVIVRLIFRGRTGAPWPTSEQLRHIGTIAAGSLY